MAQMARRSLLAPETSTRIDAVVETEALFWSAFSAAASLSVRPSLCAAGLSLLAARLAPSLLDVGGSGGMLAQIFCACRREFASAAASG